MKLRPRRDLHQKARVTRLSTGFHPILLARAKAMRKPPALVRGSQWGQRHERVMREQMRTPESPWEGVFTGFGKWEHAGERGHIIAKRNKSDHIEWHEAAPHNPKSRTIIRRTPVGISLVRKNWNEKGQLVSTEIGTARKNNTNIVKTDAFNLRENAALFDVVIIPPVKGKWNENVVRDTRTVAFYFLPSKKRLRASAQ